MRFFCFGGDRPMRASGTQCDASESAFKCGERESICNPLLFGIKHLQQEDGTERLSPRCVKTVIPPSVDGVKRDLSPTQTCALDMTASGQSDFQIAKDMVQILGDKHPKAALAAWRAFADQLYDGCEINEHDGRFTMPYPRSCQACMVIIRRVTSMNSHFRRRDDCELNPFDTSAEGTTRLRGAETPKAPVPSSGRPVENGAPEKPVPRQAPETNEPKDKVPKKEPAFDRDGNGPTNRSLLETI